MSLLRSAYPSLRPLLTRRALSAAAIATLAVALGVSLAVFSLCDRVIFRPLALRDPTSLVTVEVTSTDRDGRPRLQSSLYWAPASHILESSSFESVAAISTPGDPATTRMSVSVGSDGTLVDGAFVTAHYFAVLGVVPSHGRTFGVDDDTSRGPAVAMLSHRLWTLLFAQDPAAVGRVIAVNGVPVRIVGIVPRTFRGISLVNEPPGLYLPLLAAPDLANQDGLQSDGRGAFAFASPQSPLRTQFQASPISPITSVVIVARIGQGQRERVEAEVAGILSSGNPRLIPLSERVMPPGSATEVGSLLWLLVGAVSLTFLAACASVASLVVALLEERRQEFAIRLALGCRTARCVGESTLQVGVVILAGLLLACLVAYLIDRGMSAFVLPGNVAWSSLRPVEIGRIAAGGVALAAVVGAWVVPVIALRVLRQDWPGQIGGLARVVPRAGVTPLFVAIQVGLSLLFVAGGLVFAATVSASMSIDVGFDRRNLTAAAVRVPPARIFDLRAERSLIDRVRQTPGITAVTVGPSPLIQAADEVRTNVIVNGRTFLASSRLNVVYAGPAFFATLGQRIVQGRAFGEEDREGGMLVAILNEAAVRAFLSTSEPLGQAIGFAGLRPGNAGPLKMFTVVGVAGDVKLRALTDDNDQAVIYLPRAQHEAYLAGRAAGGPIHLVVRTNPGAPAEYLLRRTMLELGWRVDSVKSIEAAVDEILMPQRLSRLVFGLLGASALAISMLGVYSLLSHVVTRSRKEIGVRRALGAGTAAVWRVIVRNVAYPVTLGVIAGTVGASVGIRAVKGFLYALHGSHIVWIVAAVVVVLLSVFVAVLGPTRRASSIDPMEVLRADDI